MDSKEIHLFKGEAEGDDRVKEALRSILNSGDADGLADGILCRAAAVIITIRRSPEADCPLKVEEMLYVNEFFTGLPEDCEKVLNIPHDQSLGDKIEIKKLVKARD
ncbi:MAG: hypothetical protein K2K97_04100 [Muribaculaceae bacterium]|nr:hypothetical protein [Muribaculaceae bacterium]